MSGPSSPRFRIRLDDGSETPIASVETLVGRLIGGDIRPHTLLYDGSTGEWAPAGRSAVVRFMLEEMAREGRELPEGWGRPDGSGIDSGVLETPDQRGVEPAALEPSSPPGEEGSKDPLDFGLTLAEPPEAEPVAEVPTPPKAGDPGSAPVIEDWITPAEAGGLLGEAESAPTQAGRTPTSPSRPASSPKPDRGAPVRTGRSLSQEWGAAILILVAAGALAGAGLLFGDGWGEGEASGSGSALPDLSPPSGLETAVEGVLGRFSVRIQALVDSLRETHGLAGAPPPEWLSGTYLANASAFPGVRAFWEGYATLLEELRLRERAIFLSATSEGAASLPEDQTAGGLEAYLRERYAHAAPERHERYDQLSLAARRAVELHDFLVAREAVLRFTPALGAAVPRDPVLEVGTDDPEVRRELEAHLDRMFEALDRSRGGGAPSPAGLQADLFLSFGEL